jgi:hypothetical protein
MSSIQLFHVNDVEKAIDLALQNRQFSLAQVLINHRDTLIKKYVQEEHD